MKLELDRSLRFTPFAALALLAGCVTSHDSPSGPGPGAAPDSAAVDDQAQPAEASAAVTPDKDGPPVITMDARGLRIKSADGDSSMRIGGRLQADVNQHSNVGGLDPLIQDGTELRRARLELKGTQAEDVIWAAELDFAGNNTSIKDFWVGMKPDEGPQTTFGNQKQPYSLDVEMSSNDIPFVERGIDTALVIPFVDRAIGVRFQDNTDSFFYAVGAFGEGVSGNAVDDEGWGLVGRAVVAPVQEDDEVVHLGARAAWRRLEDGGGGTRVRDESTNMSNFRVVDTGVFAADGVTLYGAEAVWVKGPFSIGGEYNQASFDATGNDPAFSSWHAQATYTLTGESRADSYRMSAGEFKRLKAEKKSRRPWELAARIANIDLQDGSVTGGEQSAFSLGLNWYYASNIRMLLGWTHVLDTKGGSAQTRDAEGLDVFTFRLQFVF